MTGVVTRMFVFMAACCLAACGGGGLGQGGSDPSDARLESLGVSAGSLTPPFDPATLTYTVGPAVEPGSVTLTPTAMDPGATVAVNGMPTPSGTPSEAVALASGLTPVTVEVTARDGTSTSVYTILFERSLSGEQAYLKASNADASDAFGGSVAISGDTLVVGAIAEDGDGSSEFDNSATTSGAAYVFVRSGTSWTQEAYLKARNADMGDQFGGGSFSGMGVAISGDTIVVGAPNEDSDGSSEDDNSASNAGAAYVFVRSGTSWTQQAYLKASNADANDQFGENVSISGDTIIVGADNEDGDGSSEDDNSADNAGAAYVFVRSGTSWSQQAYLKALAAEAGDRFGDGVSSSGNTVVVGAPSTRSGGAAYVYVRSGETWTRQAELEAPNAGYFGMRLSISDDTLVVSAWAEPGDNGESRAGAAYVFVRSGTTWAQQGRLTASNAEEEDRFGRRVSISGDTIIAVSNGEDGDGSSEDDNSAENAGAVYVFIRSGTTWTQQAYLKASNAEANDRFGKNISISGDTIVIGASGEDSDGSSEADNSLVGSGAVYVYR